jgi:hypothetical protein
LLHSVFAPLQCNTSESGISGKILSPPFATKSILAEEREAAEWGEEFLLFLFPCLTFLCLVMTLPFLRFTSSLWLRLPRWVFELRLCFIVV